MTQLTASKAIMTWGVGRPVPLDHGRNEEEDQRLDLLKGATMTSKAGRNDGCPCGSGKKFKKCCELKETKSRANMTLLVIVGLLMAAGLAVGISALTGEKDIARPGGVWSAEHGHYH